MSSATLPKIALGTWLMGGAKDADPNNDDERDIEVIRCALSSGVKLIDTAQNYAAGKCEQLVGKAVELSERESYQVLTKQIRTELSYNQVMAGCQSSLKRLDLDYIDYFVCHAPNTDFDMREFFKAANQLYKEGSIRHVGVSNFGPKMLRIALDASELPISLNQVSFSLQDGDILATGTYDFCLKNNIPIQAYRTLTGLQDDKRAMSTLATIAQKYNLSPHQVAIAFIHGYEKVALTIRASTAEHWQQIKDALEVQLDASDTDTLRNLQSTGKGRFTDYLLM